MHIVHMDDQVRVLLTKAPWDRVRSKVSTHVWRTSLDNIWDPVWDVIPHHVLMHSENEVKDAHRAHG